jgi:D-3-phosphoglycerate dehydrogenase
MAYKVLMAQDMNQPGKKLLAENGYELVFAPQEDANVMKELISDCDAVLSKTFFLTKDILACGKKLQVVAKHGTGIDNVVDAHAATKLGIYVVRTPLANVHSVAEHVMCAILSLSKCIFTMDKATRNADFDAPLRQEIREVRGKTLGILGLGNIGTALASIASLGFHMEIIGYDPYVDARSLPSYIQITDNIDFLFAASDFLSLHMTATPETTGMVDFKRLSGMKQSAFFINFSRGSVVNEADLYKALTNGVIRGAALDVFAAEPVEKENPLLSLDNVILSPHSAALSVEAMDRMSYQSAQGIVEVLSGKTPTWCVNYDEVLKVRLSRT